MSNMTKESLDHAGPAHSDFKGKFNSFESKVESLAHDGEKRIADSAKKLMKESSSYVESSRQFVKENPVKCLAIAAAIGATAGSLGAILLRKK
ncbi:MAG: hypothetical protein H7256_14805 [Bdellovibrio sp.]|nr:hypothetical protein [Bdellovibrio sp.]